MGQFLCSLLYLFCFPFVYLDCSSNCVPVPCFMTPKIKPLVQDAAVRSLLLLKYVSGQSWLFLVPAPKPSPPKHWYGVTLRLECVEPCLCTVCEWGKVSVSVCVVYMQYKYVVWYYSDLFLNAYCDVFATIFVILILISHCLYCDYRHVFEPGDS